MRIALALERYHTAAHGDVDRTPMMRWSDSSPLVNDLMAAGIRLCSYMIGVDPERSQTLIVPLRSMHHACSDWRSQTFCADSLTDMNPSISRGATLQNVTLHRPQYVALARCSDHSAEPTEKTASAHHRDGAESSALRQHSGHSGAMPAVTLQMQSGDTDTLIACGESKVV